MENAKMTRMRRYASLLGLVAAMTALVMAVSISAEVLAQARLTIGGSQSNFGRHALRGGFMPDPFTAPITSGGNIDASTLGLGPNCRGFVTRQPDYIVDYDAPASFLRFYFVGQGDTTLVISDGAGRWQCNDDSFGGSNPTVDINRPARGQYDVWVGSYRTGENVRGTLHVTEMRTQHP
jgi:hypothetical protein